MLVLNKINIKVNKNNETIADYNGIVDKKAFRFAMLKNIIEAQNADIIFILDTNLCIGRQQAKESIDNIIGMGLKPIVLPIASDPRFFWGISVNPQGGKEHEKLFLIKINPGTFSYELFCAICNFDIAMGIGAQQPMEDICERLRLDGIKSICDSFEKFCYDSLLCTTIRCSFCAHKHIREAVK